MTQSLTLRRDFDAPIAMVWDAWTDPAFLVTWLGPREWPAVEVDADVTVGGRWQATLRAASGEELRQGGRYLVLDAPHHLEFTFRWESDNHEDGPGVDTKVTVRLRALGDARTRMDFEQTGLVSSESAEGHEGGWTSTFDRLAERLA